MEDKVKVSILYNCGCGYKTATYQEAIEHVSRTGHAISVAGLIRPIEGASSTKQAKDTP